MKTITVYLQSRAEIIPGEPGYIVHLIDPDEGIEFERRTIGSGFAAPRAIQVPGNWELAIAGDGQQYYFDDLAPMKAVYMTTTDQVIFQHAQMRLKEAFKLKCVHIGRQVDLV